MKVTVKIGDVSHNGSLPESERWIDVAVRCPLCDNASLPVIGDKRRQTVGHDTVTAPALSMCCGQEVGTVLVELGTIFGLEEDERVLHGRPRVY